MKYFMFLFKLRHFLSILAILSISYPYIFMAVAEAGNASYIGLSNQVARRRQLEVATNNAANMNTIGYEEDDVIFQAYQLKQNDKHSNSFVQAKDVYKPGDKGPLTPTSRPLDIAIDGSGYFKLITPKGSRYTLDGAMHVNSSGILVNGDNYPYSTQDGTQVIIPDNTRNIRIGEDGIVYADGEDVGQIGVFGFSKNNRLIKQGKSMYMSREEGAVIEDARILSGVLRMSNVNSALAMVKLMEMEQSLRMSTNLISEIGELERTVLSKVPNN